MKANILALTFISPVVFLIIYVGVMMNEPRTNEKNRGWCA